MSSENAYERSIYGDTNSVSVRSNSQWGQQFPRAQSWLPKNTKNVELLTILDTMTGMPRKNMEISRQYCD